VTCTTLQHITKKWHLLHKSLFAADSRCTTTHVNQEPTGTPVAPPANEIIAIRCSRMRGNHIAHGPRTVDPRFDRRGIDPKCPLSRCPVLTIGPNVDLPTVIPPYFQTIIYATDFSPEAAKAAVYALSFAQDGGARLVVCHARSENPQKTHGKQIADETFKKALQKLVPETSYDWCNPEFVVEHGEAAKAILGLAERTHADLIVLGAHKSSFWLTHFPPGIAPDLLASARCPVMTVC
jgi:nucleotide-binding universal stress UspA family protein